MWDEAAKLWTLPGADGSAPPPPETPSAEQVAMEVTPPRAVPACSPPRSALRLGDVGRGHASLLAD